jgi:hypothetical protein
MSEDKLRYAVPMPVAVGRSGEEIRSKNWNGRRADRERALFAVAASRPGDCGELRAERPGLGIAELAGMLGMSRSTVHRYVDPGGAGSIWSRTRASPLADPAPRTWD